jgi:membrane fusion protein (multidrug efflux system)
VFVVESGDGAQQVERRMIETGEIRNGRIAVSQGLTAGETIVSAGHNKLRNGMAVVPSASDRLSSAKTE